MFLRYAVSTAIQYSYSRSGDRTFWEVLVVGSFRTRESITFKRRCADWLFSVLGGWWVIVSRRGRCLDESVAGARRSKFGPRCQDFDHHPRRARPKAGGECECLGLGVCLRMMDVSLPFFTRDALDVARLSADRFTALLIPSSSSLTDRHYLES